MNYYFFPDTTMPNNTTSKFQSNWEYREYMQKNATNIMKNNTYEAYNNSGNNAFVINYSNKLNNGNNKPYLFKNPSDLNMVDLGKISDLKANYLNNKSLQSRIVTTTIIPGDYLKKK